MDVTKLSKASVGCSGTRSTIAKYFPLSVHSRETPVPSLVTSDTSQAAPLSRICTAPGTANLYQEPVLLLASSLQR